MRRCALVWPADKSNLREQPRTRQGRLVCRNDLYISESGKIQPLSRFHTHPKHLPHPAGAVSIRGAEEEKYAVIDIGNPEFGVRGHILEETEVSRALFELYEGAIVSQGFHLSCFCLPTFALVIVPPSGKNLPGKSHHTVTWYFVTEGRRSKKSITTRSKLSS